MSAVSTRDALVRGLHDALRCNCDSGAGHDMVVDELFASGAVIDAANPSADLTQALVQEMTLHVEHFAAWFNEARVRVRLKDVGGIQCMCGWSHGPTAGGYRPWREFHTHQVESMLRVIAECAS